ncbi:MAG: FtsW/RodA/SpoVE family cell cycle protein [Ktedonobacteraceae bacterium]|nr:FtsW/RodA/SpoVE family cell cycle protein [Ktedonobacteraceae bacterium]
MASQSPGAITRYRWRELALFILPFLIMLIGMTMLLVGGPGANKQAAFSPKSLPIFQDMIPVIGLIGALLVANVIMSIFFRKADQLLLPLVGLLSAMGVLMATRLGPNIAVFRKNAAYAATYGPKQLIWVLIGLTLCLATMFILRNTNWFERYKYTWIAVGFLAILPSVIAGIRTLHSGAPTHDTLGVGPFQLQPSELLKVAIVIFFAAYLSENRDIFSQGYMRLGRLRLPPLRQLGPLMLMLGLALMIFLVVRELGLALLIYGLFLSMMYLGSGKISYVLISLGLFVILAFIGYGLLPYVRSRFAVVGFDVVNWQNWTPGQEFFAINQGAQVVQGLIALSSGGILGSGLGLGHPVLVPVIESDMIFTGLGEEFGLAGLFAILGIYLLIVYRGYRIAIEATNPFNQLLAAGLTSIFAIQTLIICGGNMKFLPLTGIPLPFLSYGGSSVFANFIIIGILLRISYNTAMEREGTE